jgi:glycosyltransferase involved in cell wall biosynthesis
MPSPDRTTPGHPGRLAVALDVVPMLGSPTGVGGMCGLLLRELMGRPELELSGYAVGLHGRAAHAVVPHGLRVRSLPVPTRVANGLWSYFRVPNADIVAPGASVVHGTNFVVVPPGRKGAVVTVHDLTAWRWPELCSRTSLAYPRLLRRALEAGAFVHTPSRFVAAEVIALTGAPASRVRAIAWAPSPEWGSGRSLGAATFRVPSPYVLAIGTIEPRKDYPNLVRAFSDLAGDRPGLHLVIAGSDGWGAAALGQAIEASAVSSRIIQLGYVDEPTRVSLLEGASLLAYPSLYEGFGLPPLEAMALGVPVVTTTAGAIPEVVGDGAVTVSPGDPDSLAEGIAHVIDDPAFRSQLISRGRLNAERYSWSRTGDAMVQLYRDADAGHG